MNTILKHMGTVFPACGSEGKTSQVEGKQVQRPQGWRMLGKLRNSKEAGVMSSEDQRESSRRSGLNGGLVATESARPS